MEEKNVEVVEEFVEEAVEKKETVIDKAKNLGKQAIDKVKDGVEYVKNNPDKVAENGAKIATGLGAFALIALGISTDKKLSRTVYSEEIGECVELKKKLTNKDKEELDYRMKTGQTKIQALQDMNMIK